MYDAKGTAKCAWQFKEEILKVYSGNAHVYEGMPNKTSKVLPIDDRSLESLRNFIRANPIYSDMYSVDITETPCTICEGDLSTYWLDSLKHDASYAPFYTTWMISAMILAKTLAVFDVKEAVDIGSGDGRIAYCSSTENIKTHSIEIDQGLAELQKEISEKTKVSYQIHNADATLFNYAKLNLDRPVFFIGGLPEIGELLAEQVIEKVINSGIKSPLFVLSGSLAMKNTTKDPAEWGWGNLLAKLGLEVKLMLELPTQWTVEQPRGTPYVFVKVAKN